MKIFVLLLCIQTRPIPYLRSQSDFIQGNAIQPSDFSFYSILGYFFVDTVLCLYLFLENFLVLLCNFATCILRLAIFFYRYTDAVNLLRRLLNTFISDGRRGYWVLRLSVNLEHLGRLEESLRTAEDGLLDPWVRAGSRVALQRRVLRLGKPPRRWKIPSYASSIKRKIAEVNGF